METRDFTTRLQSLKNIAAKAREDQLRAEQDLENARRQLEETERQCRELGVEPDQLEPTIQALEQELGETLSRIEAIIPEEYRQVVQRSAPSPWGR